MSDGKPKPMYRTERVQCVECLKYYNCQPDNPEDRCECPHCLSDN